MVLIAGIGGSNMISYSSASNYFDSIKFALKCLSIVENDGNCLNCTIHYEDFAVANV